MIEVDLQEDPNPRFAELPWSCFRSGAIKATVPSMKFRKLFSGVEAPALFFSGLGLALLCAGCSVPDTSRSPPKRLQLACKPVETSQEAELIFVLDTGREEATWINSPRPLRGKLSVSNVEYRFILPGDKRAPASAAFVNRYDGVMTRDVGTPPFLQEAGPAKGNVRQSLICAAKPDEPRF
ncbi:hypothetical protein [Brevundimonas naejangsanensis]